MSIFSWSRIEKELEQMQSNSVYKDFISKFVDCKTVGYVAHGGNLGIADHAAIDATRHTDKMCYAPGSGVVTTSLINDFDSLWQREWIRRSKLDAYVILTASGSSTSISRAVNYLEVQNIPHIVLTGIAHNFKNQVVLDLEHYHEYEVAALAATYMMLDTGGYNCPKINEKS